ncbi:MAG TPA: hypothetical protein PLY69_08990 [Bacteroidales bacterium]|nr:hypothetical protein [Bacteroidales bacterium]
MTEIERINLEISKRKCEIAELEKQKKEEEEKEKAKYTRWKPNMGEKYYFIKSNLSICPEPWHDYCFDHSLYRAYNCFQTEEEAKEARDHLEIVLKMVSLKQFFPEIKILTSLSKFANSERCSEASRLFNKWNKE